MTTTAEILRQARSLIDTPDKWCQGKYATDTYAEADELFPMSDDACRWCAQGAVMRVVGENDSYGHVSPKVRATLNDAVQGILPGDFHFVHEFNDFYTTTHEDIMNLFDKAIKIAEGS